MILATLLFAAANACAGGSHETVAPVPQKTLRILVSWPESDPNSRLLLDLTHDYQRVDSSLKLRFEVVPSDYLKHRVNVYIASADAPDVFSYDSGRTLLDLINADKVVNIEDAFKALGICDVLNEGAVSLLKRLVGGKGLYDLPMGWNLEGIWYNKAIFSRLGLEVPRTWADLETVCRKLVDNGIQPFTVGGKDKWPLTRFVNMYVMRRLGVDAMSEASDGKLRFTDPGFVEAARVVQKMALDGYFGSSFNTTDPATATLRFLAGKAAMIYNGSWMVADLNDPKENTLGTGVGFFNVPLVSRGEGTMSDYSVNAGTILALSKDRYDTATAGWAKFVFSKIGNQAMSDYGVLKGYRVTDMPAELPYYTRMLSDEFTRVKNAGLWFEATLDARTENVAKDDVQLLLTGNMTPYDYFAAIQQSTNAYLKSGREASNE